MGKKKQNNAKQRNNRGGQRSVAAAYASKATSGVARVSRSRVDDCRIVHSELVASIDGTSAFTVASSIALNPGLAASFPWLSIEARGWERYKFNKLAFRYRTRTGTSIPGSMMFAPDYDSADPPPTTEQQASSYAGTQEDAPWKDIYVPLNPKSLLGGLSSKYVRAAALSGEASDIKTYDSGNLHVCTVDGTDAVHWGKLFVEYDVTFYTPQLSTAPDPGPPAPTASASVRAGGGDGNRSNIFGSAPVFTGDLVVSLLGNSVIFLTPGQYFLWIKYDGTVLIDTLAAMTGTVTNAVYFPVNMHNTAGTIGTIFVVVNATAAGQYISFDLSTSCATVDADTAAMDVMQCQYTPVAATL